MPKMIVSFRSTDHQSSAIEVLFTGSKTAPRVRLVEISGLRSGWPPTVIANWVRQSFGSPVLGQRKLSLRPFAVTAVVCGGYNSLRVGARRRLPNHPPRPTPLAGCSRAPNHRGFFLP